MRKIRVLLALVVLAGLSLGVPDGARPAYAAGSQADAAGRYIEALGNQALSVISDGALGKNQKQKKLEGLFADNVDFNWVARFVMGRFWRQATQEQKDRYVEEYKKFLILHYTSRFTDYTSGTFKVTSTREDGENEYTVSMTMRSSDKNSEPVLVDYRVRKSGKSFKIFDVIVEGVSMITTQRSEFASVLSSKGIDYLINQLATRSQSGEGNAGDPKIARK